MPDGTEHDYGNGEHRLRAVTFGRFISHHFEPNDFPWPLIDGRWLPHALRPPSR